MQFFPSGTVYDFMRIRRACALVSLLMVIASIVAIFRPGPNLGTDFKGGTEIEVAFGEGVSSDDIRAAVRSSGFSNPDVVKVDDENNPNRYLIRVQEVSEISEEKRTEIERVFCYGEGLDPAACPEDKQATEVKISPGGDKISLRFRSAPDLAEVRERASKIDGLALRPGDGNPLLQNARDHKVEVQLMSRGDQLMNGLRTNLGEAKVPAEPLRVEWIGPKAGAQLRDAALKSIAISLVFIMAYIAFRFDLRFAPGAVVALIHDAVITVGILTLMRKEVNLTTVAAVLTIIGYSVNDTVVVFDRVRENLGKIRGATFASLINVSLSEMLSRTLITSGTTVFSLLAFFVRGTGTLKDFALTLIIGLILGTYSSIYVALPFTEWLDRKFFARAMPKKRRGPARKSEEATV
ncbi:MAG: protein translocase subunit SecF [Polyangiaceae bacterium]|nr:protein translocase subunit SecF [Polyangiaceae bacterium]